MTPKEKQKQLLTKIMEADAKDGLYNQMIMTPKEKALELWWKYYSRIEHTLSEEYSPHEKDITKYLAVTAVDEIINTLNFDIRDLDVRGSVLLDLIQYWKDVKQEIEKL